jgi:hypothetical protein
MESEFEEIDLSTSFAEREVELDSAHLSIEFYGDGLHCWKSSRKPRWCRQLVWTGALSPQHLLLRCWQKIKITRLKSSNHFWLFWKKIFPSPKSWKLLLQFVANCTSLLHPIYHEGLHTDTLGSAFSRDYLEMFDLSLVVLHERPRLETRALRMLAKSSSGCVPLRVQFLTRRSILISPL